EPAGAGGSDSPEHLPDRAGNQGREARRRGVRWTVPRRGRDRAAPWGTGEEAPAAEKAEREPWQRAPKGAGSPVSSVGCPAAASGGSSSLPASCGPKYRGSGALEAPDF